MESRDVMILAIIISICHKIDAKLNVIPRDTEVKINDSTYMNCSTSLQADLVQWRHGNNYVYTAIGIFETYNERFSVDINALTGASNLVIRSVQPSDAGKYECVEDEGVGDRRSVQLIVLDADPICKSNTHSDGVIGPNSCGIKPDVVQLLCRVTYHGHIPPILQWKSSGDNQPVSPTGVTFKNNEVTYKLTMKSTPDLNNASFICEATRTSERQYNCSSDIIKIMYVFSSEVTVNMTMNDEVNCSANTSQSCSYKWKWFSGDDISKESDNQTLKPKKVGWHRCEATCLFGNRLCRVEVMYAEVFQTEVPSIHAKVYSDSITEVYSEAATNRQPQMSLLALLLLPAIVAIVAVVYCRRKRKTERSKNKDTEEVEEQQQRLLDGLPEKYKTDLVLIETITTKSLEQEKKQIRGLTILDKELFVVFKWSSSVEIYDSMRFSFSREWNLPETIHVQDIVSCNRNKCLYINGYKDKSQNEILKIYPNVKLIEKWSTGDDWGWGLSLTVESNVILTVYNKNKLNEYSPDGQLIRELNLPSKADLRFPCHAIKLTNGHFVVSYSDGRDDLHRVCIVDADGKLKKSFGENLGSNIGQLNAPLHLCVDENGFVMIADCNNSRVLLFDSDLEFKRAILSKEKHGLRFLTRILQDETNVRLFVADKDGRILIFQFCG